MAGLAAVVDEVSGEESGKSLVLRRFSGDERMCGYIPEVSHARIAHCAHVVPSSFVCCAYMNKYSFKASSGIGGLGVKVRALDLEGPDRKVQLLRKIRDNDVREAIEQSVRCRKISMMEIALHLMSEPLTWSSFYCRQIWVVLPMEKKKFVLQGQISEGVKGGGDYRKYTRRDVGKYGDMSMEQYFGLSDVDFIADRREGVTLVRASDVRARDDGEDKMNVVMQDGEVKKCVARVQLVRGKGRQFMQRICWFFVARYVSHVDVAEVWDFAGGEEAWDGACRSGALGDGGKHLRGEAACTEVGKRYVEELTAVMTAEGHREPAVDAAKEKVADAVSCCVRNMRGERDVAVEGNTAATPCMDGDTQSENGGSDEPNTGRRKWQGNFEAAGYVLNSEVSEDGGVVKEFPEEARELVRKLKGDQRELALEILDTVARGHEGETRYVRGAAGRGKSVVRKALEAEFRRVGLKVKTLGVAAIVALDTAGGGGATVMSVANSWATRDVVSSIVYDMSQYDILFIEEVGMMTATSLKRVGEMLQRAGALRRRRWGDFRQLSELTSSSYGGYFVVAFGDLLQLGATGGVPVFRDSRYWGSCFAKTTMVLRESHRNDDELDCFANALREFSFRTSSVEEREWIVSKVRERELQPNGMTSSGSRPSLSATILSPRFERAVELGDVVLRSSDAEGEEGQRIGWGKELSVAEAELYAVGKGVEGEESVSSMLAARDDEGAGLKRALRADHTRVPKLLLREGMELVITVNKSSGSRGLSSAQRAVLGSDAAGGERNGGFAYCNGEVVKLNGVRKDRSGKVVELVLKRGAGHDHALIKMKKTASSSPALSKVKNRKSLKGIFKGRGGGRRTTVVGWKQFNVIPAVGQTTHKAQGRSVDEGIADMGAERSAYGGGVGYTAVTRVRKWRDLYFKDVPRSDEDLLLRLQADEAVVFADRETEAGSVWLERRRSAFEERVREIVTVGL